MNVVSIQNPAQNTTLDDSVIRNVIATSKNCSEEKIYTEHATLYNLNFITTLKEQCNTDIIQNIPVEIFKTMRFAPITFSNKNFSIVVDNP